jgi:hypothetical protein
MAPESPQKQSPDAIGLLQGLSRLKHQRVASGGLDPRLAGLRQWQTSRLARSYADLLAHPRFAPPCRFFLDDIYSPRDFTQRDHDMLQLHDFMQRFVPAVMMRPLTLTVTLHGLTEKLDQALCAMLFDVMQAPEVSLAAYAEAYRRCNNYGERAEQITLVGQIGRDLDRIVRQPLTGTFLGLAAGPARRAGWEELTGFLERGYRAFKQMGGPKAFLELVRRRETHYLDRIYAGDPDPYGWEAQDPEDQVPLGQ